MVWQIFYIRDIKTKERKSKEEKEQRALGLGVSKPCGKKLPACDTKLALLKKYVTTLQAGIMWRVGSSSFFRVSVSVSFWIVWYFLV